MAALPQSTNARARAIECLSKLPALSPLLMRLIQTMLGDTDDISVTRVAQLIERDAVIAGNILRVVNSPIYQRRTVIQSIRHAIVLLGLPKVRNLALGMSINHFSAKAKGVPDWSTSEFNQHSVAMALLCDRLTHQLGVIGGDVAFLGGLFHDFGRLLIAVGLPTQYSEVARLRAAGQSSLPQCERSVLGFDHADLSGEVLATWRLPLTLQTAVRFHHAPENDLILVKPGEFRLSQILNAAELHIEDNVPDGLHSLGLDDRLEEVLTEFDAEVKQVTCLF